MDWRLARFDICVKNPVGSLDDQKKTGHTFSKQTIGWLDGQKKREGIFFFGLLTGSSSNKSDTCLETPVDRLTGPKKTGGCFFFDPLTGY